jgi:hypothetical protein
MNESIQIFLNSKDAIHLTNGMSSRPLFKLPNITIPRNREIYLSILAAQIPSSFYNIDSTNNTFIYEYIGLGSQIFIIEEGNYNIKSLVRVLKTTGFDISYSPITSRLHFSHTLDFIIYSESRCLDILGFNDDVDIISINSELMTDRAVNLFPIKSINITSDNFITNNLSSNDLNDATHLLSISNDVPHGSIIFFENKLNIRSLINNVSHLTNLSLSLKDQNGEFLDLNAFHWSIVLLLEII